MAVGRGRYRTSLPYLAGSQSSGDDRPPGRRRDLVFPRLGQPRESSFGALYRHKLEGAMSDPTGP